MNSKHRISVRSFDEFQRRRKWYETVFWFVRNVQKEKTTKAAANAVTQIKFNKNKMNWDVLSQVAIEDMREKNTDIVNRMENGGEKGIPISCMNKKNHQKNYVRAEYSHSLF